MAVTLYSSTDAGAPVLTNAAGSTVGVLDACLINGYGSKAAAGWQTIYNNTNQRTYQAKTGNQFFLNVDDSQGTNFYARGFQTMTAWNTGTNAFPSTTQVSGNGTSNPRTSVAGAEWWVIATPTFFYFIWDTKETSWNSSSNLMCFYFGDVQSYKAPDPYATVICANPQSSNFCNGLTNSNNYALTTCNCFLARRYDGINVSSPAVLAPVCGYMVNALLSLPATNGPVGPGANIQAIGGTPGPFPYPEVVTNSLLVSPFYLMEWTGTGPALRGWLPGLYGPAQSLPLGNGAVFTGTSGSSLSGKTFQTFSNVLIEYMTSNSWSSSYAYGQIFIETSDTWLSTMWQ